MRLRISVFCLCLLLAVPSVPAVYAQKKASDEAVLQKVQSLKAEDITALRQRAESGDDEAQLLLALAYDGGIGVPQDWTEAAKWFRKAADNGRPLARQALGLMYYWGHGVPKDASEAASWLLLALTTKGLSPQASGILCLLYMTGNGVEKDDEMALELCKIAAEFGDPDGQYWFATLFALGRGVPRDDAKALSWFQKAAEQGHPIAQTIVGKSRLDGFGGARRDFAKAAQWFRKAADQGEPTAQYELGQLYIYGEGVRQDPMEAVKWLTKAAENGHTEAPRLLGWMYCCMVSTTQRNIPADYVTSYMWSTVADRWGNPKAGVYLAAAEGNLSEDQKAQAQQRAAEWLKQHPKGPK